MQDMLAGRIHLAFDQAASSLPQVRGGNLLAHAVTAKSRLAVAADIPTVDEAGLPGFYISVWHGLWVPKATPKDVVASSTARWSKRLPTPTVRARLVELGQELAAARATDPRGARRLPEGRDREMVADHQGRRDQGRLNASDHSALMFASRMILPYSSMRLRR